MSGSSPHDKNGGLDHFQEYFAKPGVTEALSQAHPVLLIRQMANEILRLRSSPAMTKAEELRSIAELIRMQGWVAHADRCEEGIDRPTTLSEFVNADEATRERIGREVVAGAIERQNSVSSETPRTDAEAEYAPIYELSLSCSPKFGYDVVSAKFARELEIELADAKDDCLRLHREKMDALYGPDGLPRSTAASSTGRTVHPDNIECMISSLLSVVQYDSREAAEKDLRALVEMASVPSATVPSLSEMLQKAYDITEASAKAMCWKCREGAEPEYQADPTPTYWHDATECRASGIWLLARAPRTTDGKASNG